MAIKQLGFLAMSNKVSVATQNECLMCRNKYLGDKWTQLIITGEKTSVEAASALRISIDAVEDHVYKHAQTITKIAPKNTRDKEYFLDQLEDINTKLQDALDGIMHNPELDTRKLTSLTKEIRETLKLLAEVAGVIGADNSAAMAKNLTDMQQKYLTLTGLILEVACPACQQKIVERLKGEMVAGKEITEG